MPGRKPRDITPAWLAYEEAQRYTGLGRSTLWKLVKRQEVKAAIIGKAVRLNRQSLDDFMERNLYHEEHNNPFTSKL